MSELKNKAKTTEQIVRISEVKIIKQKAQCIPFPRLSGWWVLLEDAEAEISHKNHEIGGLKAEYSRMKRVITSDIAELLIKVEQFSKWLDLMYSTGIIVSFDDAREKFVEVFGEKKNE